MSCVELHTGTLTKTKGLTVEEYCEYLCKKYGYEIAYEGDTYAETLMDDTYKVLNGELYKCDDIQKTLPIWLTLEVMELTSTLSNFTMEALG